MKIAVFHNLPHGGAMRTLREQVKHLRKKHKVYFYKTPPEFSPPQGGGVLRLLRDLQVFFSLRHIHKQLAEKINKSNADVALVHADKYTQTPYLLRYLRKPSLYFCQEYLRIVYEKELAFSEPVSVYKRFYESATRNVRKYIDQVNALYASKILVNSEFTRRNIKRAYGMDSIICHLGVNAKVFKKKTSVKKNQILFVGERNRISGYGFVKEVLDALPIRIRPTLVVLGALKKRLKVRNDNDMARYYSESLLTLCCSHNEPFGLVPLESMACETPVVAVAEGGYRETVINGVTGYLLPRNKKVFTRKIHYLLKNPAVCKRLGKTGRVHVTKNFSWRNHCRLVEKTLLKLCK